MQPWGHAAAARLISAAFAGIRFLISMTLGWLEGVDSPVAEPGVPESTRTCPPVVRCSAIGPTADVLARTARVTYSGTGYRDGYAKGQRADIGTGRVTRGHERALTGATR